MEVTSFSKSLYHGFAVGQMSEHTQFQLPVIRNNKFLTLIGNECLTNLIDVLLQGRLVLQIGLPSRQSTCLCIYVERAVNTLIGICVSPQRQDESLN